MSNSITVSLPARANWTTKQPTRPYEQHQVTDSAEVTEECRTDRVVGTARKKVASDQFIQLALVIVGEGREVCVLRRGDWWMRVIVVLAVLWCFELPVQEPGGGVVRLNHKTDVWRFWFAYCWA
jgi:hypothetical protein